MDKDLRNSRLGSNSVLALDFIAACNARDTDKMMSFFDDNSCYHNIPLEPILGAVAIRAVLEPFFLQTERVGWVVEHVAETNMGVVLVERLDRFLIDHKWIELPVMGVFEFENTMIRSWRDYFDLNQIHAGAKKSTR